MYVIQHHKREAKTAFTSKYVGVSHHPTVLKPWRAAISVWGKKRIIGYYATEREAAEAYDGIARRNGKPVNVIERED
jgi:hypothetical protein